MASIGALLQFIKEFALDLKELQSDAFKKNIGALEAKFNSDEKLRKTQSSFNKQKKTIRNEDFMVRYGRDEFVLVLLNATLQNANKKTQKLCKSIATTCYSLDDLEPGHTLSILVSIGVSVYRKGDTSASITDRADQALCVAKRIGKSRVASENEIEAS